MRSRTLAALGVATAATLALTACGAGSDTGTAPTVEPVIDGTLSIAINADPGSLNPLINAATPTHTIAALAYDFLVDVDADAKVGPWLATSWEETPTSVSYTLRDGVTCSDGSALTAQTVADNIAFITNPDSQSPLRGVYVPADATAAVDGSTVTISTPQASPFLLLSTSRVPILCDAALKDPKKADAGSVGSGMFELTTATPNSEYVYTRREGYSWGPSDATDKTAGVPKTVVVKVISNESTAANQLLSGEVNIAGINGPDQERLDAANLKASERQAIAGEMWFNHGTVTGDPEVRKALVQAVNLQDLAKIITGGRGGPGTGLVVSDPRACTDDTVTGALPAFDSAAAEATLDAAGWKRGADGIREKDGAPLDLRFFVDSLGDSHAAAADVAQQAWTKIGANVELTVGDSNKVVELLLSGKDVNGWDIAWEPLYVNLPSMVVPFLSGPAPAAGVNFAQIDNPAYSEAVAKAIGLVGPEACAAWADAEKALFAQTDIVPFANSTNKLYFAGAELVSGLRMTGSSLRLLK